MLARTELDQKSLDLLAAADYLKKHGHCKTMLVDAKGRVCLSGAIAMAVGYTENELHSGISPFDLRQVRWCLALQKVMPLVDDHDPIHWNNEAERTQQEVFDKLCEAAYSPD